MRPVERGVAPRVYARYQDANDDLQKILGDYCSYCERQIETHLATEHVRPKSAEPQYETDWDNFLLGCINCNSCKGDTPVVLDDYLWPDCDNTFRAFEYLEGGVVDVAAGLPVHIRVRAQATLELLGLDKHPAGPSEPTPKDKRWIRRRDRWGRAVRMKQDLEAADTETNRRHIEDSVKDKGLFSIWYTVFFDDPDILRRIREAMKGTAVDCFGADGEPVARPNGQL